MDSQELLIKLFILKQQLAKPRPFCFTTCLKKFASTDAWNALSQVTDPTTTNPQSKRDTLTTLNPPSLLLKCTSTSVKSTELMAAETSMKFTKTLEKLSSPKFHGSLDPVAQESHQLEMPFANPPTWNFLTSPISSNSKDSKAKTMKP